MQGNPALFCKRDDWTTYRFAIYDSWVAFDVTTILASGPKPARFSAFDVTAHYPEAPNSRGFEPNRKWNFMLLDG